MVDTVPFHEPFDPARFFAMRKGGHGTRLGSRVANVETRAWQDERDRPIAAARMNYLIARP